MEEWAKLFHEQRPKLFGLAYRMLGSRAEAEDVIQDAYLRWETTASGSLDSPQAWLTTVVTRMAIDRLRHLQVERDTYFGPWLPEPISETELQGPEATAELADDISIAFLIMLETLNPRERAAFVLREVLNEDYADIARTLDKSETACRQIVRRARQRITEQRRRYSVDTASRLRVLRQFMAALTSGNRDQLLAILAEESVMISDGGGKTTAAIRPLYGADRIAWLWFAVSRRLPNDFEMQIVLVNGRPGLAQIWNGRLHSVADIDTDGRFIHGHYTILNPDKLTAFRNLAA